MCLKAEKIIEKTTEEIVVYVVRKKYILGRYRKVIGIFSPFDNKKWELNVICEAKNDYGRHVHKARLGEYIGCGFFHSFPDINSCEKFIESYCRHQHCPHHLLFVCKAIIPITSKIVFGRISEYNIGYGLDSIASSHLKLVRAM